MELPIATRSSLDCTALAAGCTVIAKPASWTPLSLIAWLEAMHEAEVGLPENVVQVITGSGGLIGDALAAIQTSMESFSLEAYQQVKQSWQKPANNSHQLHLNWVERCQRCLP